MRLADYIETNKDRLIERWKQLAIERLSLDLSESELVDDLPEFLDDLAFADRDPEQGWPELDSARRHGRHRMRLGVDLGSLSVEVALVAEVLLMLAHEDGQEVACDQARRLSRIIGQATAASVHEYVALRDKQLASQAAQHFSFIAHEIRNPLHNAKLAAMMLTIGDQAARQRNLERLDRALAQLSDLVDNSLIQARLYGEPSVELARLDAVELARTACEDVIAHVEARGMTLTIEAQSFELEADRKLLISALTNLLKNAVKFSCDGGSVTLRARQIDQRAVFEVEDQCGGLPEELPARLFQPFVQVSEDKSGFGLGLAIVKQAVDAHHGAVRVANRPGQGCTFVIDLPLRQARAADRD
ncbi:MAG TPA: sensor histidine kinase [Enhygromyxa sp.]|nr:sensor histidine kinase [Enhygromyxa sp.]